MGATVNNVSCQKVKVFGNRFWRYQLHYLKIAVDVKMTNLNLK